MKLSPFISINYLHSVIICFIQTQLFKMLEQNENDQLRPTPQKHVQQHKVHHQQANTTQVLQPYLPNHQKRATRKLGKYEFSMEQRLGSGMSGDVYVGFDNQTFELVCVKVVDRAVYKTAQEKLLLQNQIRCQESCSSDFTIKIKDIFDTASFCFIITEFCEGGDLYRLIKTSANGLPEPLIKMFAKQIACAIGQLKQRGIVHRDIKSENILLKQGQCKLGDFGFAIEMEKLSKKQINLGSPLYMSLQALEKSEYSFASDVFSFGVVLYEMLHKQSPWECSQEGELIQRMKKEVPVIKSGVSEELKSLILGCLKQLPEERPKIEDILAHSALVLQSADQ